MANIAEILSNYPIGTKLYSPAFGVVKLKKIRPHLAVIVTDEHGEDWEVLYDGRFSLNGECMLFPSKAERDWDCFSEKRVFGGVVMKYIEAVILTICMAIVWFPFLCIGGIVAFIVEIVSFVMEQITDNIYTHGGVTDVFKWYVATIRKTYTQTINYDK